MDGLGMLSLEEKRILIEEVFEYIEHIPCREWDEVTHAIIVGAIRIYKERRGLERLMQESPNTRRFLYVKEMQSAKY